MAGIDKKCPLVFVEWEDSARPMAAWSYLADFEEPAIVKCVSVGWLIYDSHHVKALAPNMGDLGNKEALQVSGIIRIPARSITRFVKLREPD